MSEENTEVIENVEVEVNPIEAEAKNAGWLDKDAWVDAGRDAKEHRSAEIFIERGEWIGKQKELTKRMDSMERDTEQRISNLNNLHNQQIEAERAKLVAQRTASIEDRDVVGADEAQAAIDKLQVIPEQSDPTFDNWNKENSWVFDNSPKSIYAKNQVGLYQSQGKTDKQCIELMELDLSREYPNAPTPPPAGMGEHKGSSAGKKPSAQALTMSDCTAEEKALYRGYPWKNEKSFLQAVKDNRAAS